MKFFVLGLFCLLMALGVKQLQKLTQATSFPGQIPKGMLVQTQSCLPASLRTFRRRHKLTRKERWRGPFEETFFVWMY